MAEDHPLPSILAIVKYAEQATALRPRLQRQFVDYEVIVRQASEDELDLLSTEEFGEQNIALFLVEYELMANGTADRLKRLMERWPSAVRMMLRHEGQPGPEAFPEVDFFRAVTLEADENELERHFSAAERYFEQQKSLDEKSTLLAELHRASMSLTGEVNFEKLLHKLMRIVIDNADAKRGYIILMDDKGEMTIEAEGQPDDFETQFVSKPVSDFSPVCPSIVEYCITNLENLILEDAINDGFFSSHPYVRKNLCRSILCTPMVYQGRVFGALYLENRERPNAFSPYSLQFLKLLSAPAAIAIQNAQLYAGLEDRVKERTEEVVRQKETLEQQRDEINQQKEDILSSIRYAERIQKAVLPQVTDIQKTFPKSFIYYQPKDVVSGDFYWFSNRLSKSILAAADCTGHGVPGAFMTIMANTLLKQIVELEGIFKPDEILRQLHLRIRVSLQQNKTTTDHNSLDGLDIALCQLDLKRKRLLYAGANRPLVHIRGGEVTEIKAERYGVGGDFFSDEARSYELHSLDLQDGDMFYIFSDGFQDQVGGEFGKRYQRRNFNDFLLSLQGKDMEHQKLMLDAELVHWKGKHEQTDDILVMGVEV